jgi:D-tyrosyl-tRNA(Tyr) deacylase
MRSVVQRVARASVTVAGETVGSIETGLLVLVGVQVGDGPEDADVLADKLLSLRIFPDEHGRMNRSVREASGSVLVVSQFTLHGDVRKGRRPSFTEAASPDSAEPLVARVTQRISEAGLRCESGVFGARMDVDLRNDGPVTLIVEARGGRIV